MIKEEALHALEFDKVLEAISTFSNSDVSRGYILNIRPSNSREDIQKRFGEVEEIRRLLQKRMTLRLSRFDDISPVIERALPEGSVLDSRELVLLAPVLQIISDVSTQIKADNELTFLNELSCDLTGFPELLVKIEKSVDSEGNILDSASRELSLLRARIRGLEAGIKKRLGEITRDKRTAAFLQDDFITKRAGRWVIPVRMDSKGQVPGIAHDVSHSGETAFIEPLEIIGLSNEMENTIADEKAEEIRILRSICEMIRREADNILTQFRTIVYIDMLNSISGFSEFLRAEAPEINDLTVIRLARARHPLLMLFQQKGAKKEVVPADLILGKDNKAMVITGPNAGGKTITIKTVGLLLLMALSGIPVPADSSSSFPLANKILVDIGDEQSIENSLSTFSAHISKITAILKEADSGTVALIDELGTGTEPSQGSAISCAVLNELKNKGALVFATTHLTEIVGFVHRTEGMLNASMEFDRKTHSPLYRLIEGEPGQSHALEIAEKYGLPGKTIEFARHLLGTEHEEFQNLIADLKEKRVMYEDAVREMQRQRAELEENNALLKAELAEAERRGRETLEKSYEEARDMIAETKRRMNSFMEEIKREKSRDAIKKLEKVHQYVDEKIRELHKETPISLDEIKEGDVVFVRTLGYDVRIIAIDRRQNRLRVKVGNMYIEVPASDISSKQNKPAGTAAADKKTEPAEDEVQTVLNIVGLRVDEALSRLEPFLNHAALAGLEEITIIHGIGTGALLKAVREHLKDHPLVKQFRSAKESDGRDSVTIVALN